MILTFFDGSHITSVDKAITWKCTIEDSYSEIIMGTCMSQQTMVTTNKKIKCYLKHDKKESMYSYRIHNIYNSLVKKYPNTVIHHLICLP